MKTFFLMSSLLIFPSMGFAQDARTWRASLGAGIVFKKNLRAGNTYEDMDKDVLIKPIPFIQGNIGRFSLGPQGLAFMALGNHLMNASLFINRGGDRYHGLGMLPRKDSVFVGISAKFIKYGFSLSKDINGRSKGFISSLSYGEMFKLTESLMLRGGLSLDWLDDRYAEYYYGVRSFETTANRREYHLNNYFQPGVSGMLMYKATETVSVISALNVKMVPKTVRQSPTMNGDRLERVLLVGFSYAL